MSQQKKLYKVMRRGKQVATLIPGRYAGNKTHRIFGRLDCKSGMHMHKENRVFFTDWVEAMAAGYKPCRKCQPQDSDKYPEQEVLREALLAKLHIGLWHTPRAHGKPLGVWHVHMNWRESRAKKGEYRRIRLGNSEIKQSARKLAVELGKEYNLPVFNHDTEDATLIGMPILRTNDTDFARDKRKIREFLKTKKAQCFRWMF